MSAFIVDPYHINVLVSYGVATKAQYYVPARKHGAGRRGEWAYFTDDTAQAIASLLYSQNVRSVNFRYSERTKRTGHVFKSERFSHLTPADVVCACDCLDYQSCETPNWKGTEAWRALNAIRERAIRALVGESRTWELKRPE